MLRHVKADSSPLVTTLSHQSRARLKMQYVYILKSLKDSKRYIGLTNNVARRIRQHNNGEVAATKGRRPFELIHVEEYKDRIEATKREQFLKTGVGRKELNKILGS